MHRDLKPANILVVRGADGVERVTLIDFGIAQVRGPNDDKLTGAGAAIGTPAYMASEQLLGQGDIDARADLYALGVTLFECLTGSIPFMGGYARDPHAGVRARAVSQCAFLRRARAPRHLDAGAFSKA